MRSNPLWRWARIATGTVLLVLGVIGLFVPVLQGVLLIVMGLTLLSHDSDYAKQVLTWIRERLPHHAARADRFTGKEESGDA